MGGPTLSTVMFGDVSLQETSRFLGLSLTILRHFLESREV
jgi:hypothetical protein